MTDRQVLARFGCGLGALQALLLAAFGCAIESTEVTPHAHPNAGLYTPGSTHGASDPTDVPMPGAGLGNRCVSLPPVPDAGAGIGPTQGMLTLEYQTQTLEGRYAPHNCTAVWIENAQAQYVATIEVTAGLRRPGLVYWQDRACVEKLGPDAMTSATLRTHDKPHLVTWSGADFEGKPVPDGTYKLLIEVTESDKSGEEGVLTEYEFVKGPAAFQMELPVDIEGPLVRAKLSWVPGAEGSPGGTSTGD